MLRNIIKLGILCIIGTYSLQTASHYINEIVLEVERRQPTITDAIIKQQVQESFKEAEKEIEKVLKEENIVIKQEEVKMKPAAPPKEQPKKEDKVVNNEEDKEVAKAEEETLDAEMPLTEAGKTQDMPKEVGDLGVYTELTEEETTYLLNYLIDYYFLYGGKYYTVETDLVRYERKKLANDMETYIIDSIAELQEIASQMMKLKSEDIKPILEETIMIATDFKETYQNAGEIGSEFQAIYEEGNKYFEAYIKGLTDTVSVFETIETAPNKALVLPLMLKSINQDILPAVRDILNQGFAVKEKTNKIYIEGIDGSFLLTPEEVIAIINNPRSILPKQEVIAAPKTHKDTPSSLETTLPGEVTP